MCGAEDERCDACPYRQEEPRSADGELVWEVVSACQSQLRVGGMGTPFGLDFGAIMAVGVARGADPEMLAGVLPAVEVAILTGIVADGEEDLEGDAGT